MSEEKKPDEPGEPEKMRSGYGAEAEAELRRAHGLPLSRQVIRVLALSDDEALVQQARMVATPAQHEATLVLLDIMRELELDDKAHLPRLR